MRSAVSVILSSPVPDNKMSHPDYEQTAHDHAALLLLLKPIGTQIKQKTVARLCERIIKSGSRFNVYDSTVGAREILARFVREHPVENNDWGEFQTHRRLLGLITFGKYDTQTELNELCRLHETLKVKYGATLYDSRAILLGPVESTNLNEPPKSFSTPSNFKTRAVFYADESCPDLEAQIAECLNSLFWILESKRLERSREKIDRVSLLLAPFEKKDFIGLDLESRNNKKRCCGRITKHLGDLCLQAGLPGDALSHYNSAASILQAVNDWLWLGAAYEGLCTASALVLYPNMCRSLPLQRNSSLQEGSPGKQRRGSQAVTLPTPPTIDVLKASMPHILPPEEISKKYREAIIHYSKYQNAGIIETEASFKATRISIEQNCTLQATSFLNNVLFINLTLSEQEKIDRFTTLSELFTSFGFARKASFCLRLAATRHVSQNNPNPDWQQCYNLMLQVTSGFKLSLDPVEMPSDGQRGWPAIQIQVINELVAAANRMGNPALATRHMTFLLQTMFNHLTPQERKDITLQLQAVSQQCEGAPVPLVLDSGTVIPPANLTNIPKTKSFTLKNLQPHLQPQKVERIKEDHGPFLFTPINFGSLERKNTSKSKMDYLWVEGDICEVSMQLINPLPFELHVSNMRLLTNGIVFESIPETITLPAESGPIAVTLAGTPKEVGDLEILGFSTHTLGVKSNCRLRYMENMPHPQYSVEVVPALPRIDVATSLPQTASFSSGDNIVTSASVTLYGGESSECTITITNVGQVPIEMIEISVQSTLDAPTESKIFNWSDENLKTQLPLQPGASASLTLYLYAVVDFLAPTSRNEISSSAYLSQPSSIMSHSGPSSLPSRLSSPSHHTKRQSELTSSFRSGLSSHSGHSSLASTRLSKLAVPLHASNIIEGQLKIKYSGDAGLAAGYCRISSVFVTIEMLPSVQITSWDVLPAETPAQFYLVLDVTNMTNHEMELHYTQTKCIYMEGREPCRIPVPVDRCPLNKLSVLNEGGDSAELERICAEHIASLVDLRWQLLGIESSGKATLSGLTLTQDMLDLVRMSPLQWEITINDIAVKAQDELTCGLGECVSVGVGVCNALEHSLSDLILSINFYQDHQNGVNNYRLDTRLSIAGANKVMLPTLQEYGRAYHECRVVFFTAGQYKIDIQCSSRESTPTALAICSELINAGHTWRYIPPLEITVGEC
ncbi:protein brunelleschi [Cephus cinctus]|uniref:Protein brunelleschi n=1 Tax=Cephus cinctus TaxID=211228 RepID=A0AAJ7C9R0_CEPCN|nr:protein brunelleschi [Cephus cinctus]XP_015605442.1 protein brunelleschi [Cephus cinctus]